MVSVRFADWVNAGVLLSVTLNVKARFVTATVGVPVIAPVAPFSVKPAGRVPLMTVHAYGVTPPTAARVAV